MTSPIVSAQDAKVLLEGTTDGPWELCQHLKSLECDAACRCGYRGVIFGPDHNVAYAICQPGHEPAPEGQEDSEPARYPRAVELANMRLTASAPSLAHTIIAQDAEAKRKDAEIAELRSALGEAFYTLTYISAAGEDDACNAAAKEAVDKIDAVLGPAS